MKRSVSSVVHRELATIARASAVVVACTVVVVCTATALAQEQREAGATLDGEVAVARLMPSAPPGQATPAATPAAAPTVIVVDHGALAADEGVYQIANDHHGARWHDGFYLRFGFGGGVFVDQFDGALDWTDGSASGGSGALELSVGTALWSGFTVGGGIVLERVVDPVVEMEGASTGSDVAVGVLGVLGAFFDWYPDPGRGLHLQALLGGARITMTDESGVRNAHEPIGGGIALGVGHEWWIGEQWSMGALVRGTAATLYDEGVTHRAAALSLSLTLTLN